jgi:hypothetical protein
MRAVGRGPRARGISASGGATAASRTIRDVSSTAQTPRRAAKAYMPLRRDSHWVHIDGMGMAGRAGPTFANIAPRSQLAQQVPPLDSG